MILYHGTNKAFDTIDLTKSKPNKDFGQGFYLSREYSQAMEMAKTKFDQIKTGFPTVLTYEVDEQQMNQLNVLRFDAYFRMGAVHPYESPQRHRQTHA